MAGSRIQRNLARLGRQAGRAVDWASRHRRRAQEAHGLVLMYHRVASVPVDPWGLAVSPSNFADQVSTLSRHADIVPLARMRDSLRQGQSPRPVVSITFDDGYSDNLELAKPILERFRSPATVFVATGFTGRPDAFWWDRLAHAVLLPKTLPTMLQLGDGTTGFTWSEARLDQTARRRLHDNLWDWLDRRPEKDRLVDLDHLERWAGVGQPDRRWSRAMTETEMRKLVEGGLVDVGAHTVSHPRLTRLPREQRQAEIVDSRNDCRRMLGVEPSCFAFPNGDHDAECVGLVRDAGFAVACTSRPDLVWASGDAHAMPRVSVADCPGDTLWRQLRLRWLN